MIKEFKDNDEDYLDWINTNRTGFVVNCDRTPRPAYLMLHLAICPTITGHPANGEVWTRYYIKICSIPREELEEWGMKKIGAELRPCRICKP